MPKKKTKTTKKVARQAKADAATGKRLTEEQKLAIAQEPDTLTLAQIAEKYDTTVNTVSRYRKAAPALTTAPKESRSTTTTPASKGGVDVQVEGDFIVFRVPKNGLAKQLLSSLLDN